MDVFDRKSNESHRSGEIGRSQISDIKIFTASESSFKIRCIFLGHPADMSEIFSKTNLFLFF